MNLPLFDVRLAAIGLLLLVGCTAEPPPEPAPPPPAAEAAVESSATAAAAPTLAAPSPRAFDIESYARDLETLSSDAFEGRAPGSRGERLTVDYLVRAYAEAGLKPGYGESYLQPVPMVELTNQERSSIALDQAGESLELVFPDQMIIGSKRPGTDFHGVEDSELVFVGYGVVAPEYDWNDYAGLDVAGKTVVILVNDPGFAPSMVER
jgi:hypothetical protein